MNEYTIMENARRVSSVVQELAELKGHLVKITRVNSRQGVPDFLRNVTGVVCDITLSCVVVHRSDITSDSGSSHPQVITFTFSDFLTGLYEYEVVA